MSDSRSQALAAKEKGNAAYKARQFDDAAAAYQQAWDLDKDITFLNNLAAVRFEEGKLDECIEVCQKAVDEGREMRADYKLVAKAFGRIGTAYMKRDDYDNAIKFFHKSLTEHRTPDIVNKLKDAERIQGEAARKAYLSPELADKARNEGNVKFKAGDFAGSITDYSEAIKRNPDDARNYTNRASAYTKLLAISEAMKDAEMAIKVDPLFAKAYCRKANVKFAMKEYSQALEILDEARAADKDGKTATEIGQIERKCRSALYEQQATETDEERIARAQRDPEVLAILQDPVIQQILNEAQKDPKALMEHMKNEGFRKKIMKLQSAGILRMGPA